MLDNTVQVVQAVQEVKEALSCRRGVEHGTQSSSKFLTVLTLNLELSTFNFEP
jgi:hypothetical protein